MMSLLTVKNFSLHRNHYHLYDWQPKLADKALDNASSINPNISELQILKGIADLTMQE